MEDGEIKNLLPEDKGRAYLRREALVFVWEILKIVFISLAIILPIRYYLVQPFFVKGASMEPTFYDRNYILIDEISYRLRDPERGDIAVFKYPKDPTQFFIKRVVGLPDETIIIKNNSVKIIDQDNPEGLILKEQYLAKEQKTLGEYHVKLGPSEYFVMGDNRLHSSDSRYWGSLDRSLITGRVFFRAFPLNEIGKFSKVTY